MFQAISNILKKSRNRYYARLTYQYVVDAVGIASSETKNSTKLKNIIEEKYEDCAQSGRIDCLGLTSVLGKYRNYESPDEDHCTSMSPQTLNEFDFYFDLHPTSRDVFNGVETIDILAAALYNESCELLNTSISLLNGDSQNKKKIFLNSDEKTIKQFMDDVNKAYKQGECSDLAYFAVNTIMLRLFMLQRNNNQVEDTIARLINLYDVDSVKDHLEYYNNHQEYLLWLYAVIENWAEQGSSLYNQLYIAGNMPTNSEFYSDPKVILRSILDLSLSAYQNNFEHRPGVRPKILNVLWSKIRVSETAKFIEKKAALWLPNEAYIASRLEHDWPQKTYRMLKHAHIETSLKMRRFNQFILGVSIISILFFLFVSVDGLIQSNLSTFAISLISLLGSGILFWHVNGILKTNQFLS